MSPSGGTNSGVGGSSYTVARLKPAVELDMETEGKILQTQESAFQGPLQIVAKKMRLSLPANYGQRHFDEAADQELGSVAAGAA